MTLVLFFYSLGCVGVVLRLARFHSIGTMSILPLHPPPEYSFRDDRAGMLCLPNYPTLDHLQGSGKPISLTGVSVTPDSGVIVLDGPVSDRLNSIHQITCKVSLPEHTLETETGNCTCISSALSR